MLLFNRDYHVHTRYSYCCERDVSVDDLVRLMPSKGINQLAITDHSSHFYFDGDTLNAGLNFLKDRRLFSAHRKKGDKKLDEYISLIRNFRQQGVLVGLEVDVMFDGNLMVSPDIKKELDIAIGAIHWLPCMQSKSKPSLKQFIDEFIHFTLGVLEKDIDILAHPTRIFTRSNLKIPKEVIDPVIDKAIKNNVALEINSHSHDPNNIFVKRCIEKGAKIAIGTDSHSLSEFGDFSFHKKMFSECGVKESDIQDPLY